MQFDEVTVFNKIDGFWGENWQIRTHVHIDVGS